MHTISSTGQLTLPTSARALRDLLLAALGAVERRPLGGNTGLPACAVDLIEHNVVLAVTPITERLFDASLVRYAAASRRDVVLVRGGSHPETLDPVKVDVALRTSFGHPVLVPDLNLWRGCDGSLHLVPDRHDLLVTLAPHGLDVLLVAPWESWDERDDGLTRAAAEVVRAVRRARDGE